MKIKELFKDKLKEKFPELSEELLNNFAKTRVKEINEEKELESYISEISLMQIIDSYLENKVSDATQSAIKSYETKYSLKDGVLASIEEDKKEQMKTDKKEQESPQWARELMGTLKELGQKVGDLENERVKVIREQRLNELIKDLPLSLQAPYKRLSLVGQNPEEFELFIEEIGKEVESLKGEVSSKGVLFDKPLSGSRVAVEESQATEEDIKRVIEAII